MQDTEALAAAEVESADSSDLIDIGGRLATSQTPRRRGADYYDTILWRLAPVNGNRHDRGFAVGMTSCVPRSGVTTVASNVAIRAADHRLGPALIVDANFARPRLERAFRVHDALGLGDVLAGKCDLSEAIHKTSVADLSVMPIGTAGIVDRVSIDQQRVDALMKELVDQYSFVMFDLPVSSKLRHSLLIARRLEAVLMVLRSESVRPKHGVQAVTQLEQDGVNVMGAVVTQQKSYLPRWFQRWL